ncbi:MAG: TldD/PmbA family protein [Myxococcota bacterium]
MTVQYEDLQPLAERVMKRALELGATEASVATSRGSHVTIQRRERQTEQATEATTQGLVLAITKGDRYTSNSTSDLRPKALDSFIQRCVQTADYIEPDEYRRLPDLDQCGRGISEAALDQDDPAWGRRTATERTDHCAQVEEAILALDLPERISTTAYVADGRSEAVQVLSNGFSDRTAGAFFTVGGQTTVAESDKRPEAGAYYAARHLGDLPDPDLIAADVAERVRRRLGSSPTASGQYSMLVENRMAGRILSILSGPMAGSALHHGRSCLNGRLDTKIASDVLTITDDPTIPRGLGSRPWDGSCLVAKPRTMIENGVLKNYHIGLYYSRKLGVQPTGGGRSNWVVKPGDRSFEDIAKELPKAILVTGFLGGNSNSTTGDFSFGIQGLLLENGEVVQSLSEMNVAGNLLTILDNLVEVANDPWTWSTVRSPAMHFANVQFSGRES